MYLCRSHNDYGRLSAQTTKDESAGAALSVPHQTNSGETPFNPFATLAWMLFLAALSESPLGGRL